MLTYPLLQYNTSGPSGLSPIIAYCVVLDLWLCCSVGVGFCPVDWGCSWVRKVVQSIASCLAANSILYGAELLWKSGQFKITDLR